MHGDGSLEPYFVMADVCIIIIVGPSNGQCQGHHLSSSRPLSYDFVDRQIVSTRSQGEYGLEASFPPRATIRATKGSSRSTELHLVCLFVTPISIGSGGWRDFRWHIYLKRALSSVGTVTGIFRPPTTGLGISAHSPRRNPDRSNSGFWVNIKRNYNSA